MDTQFHSSWLGRWLSDTFFAPSWPYLLLGRLGLHCLLRLQCVRLLHGLHRLHGLHGLLPLRFHRHLFYFNFRLDLQALDLLALVLKVPRPDFRHFVPLPSQMLEPERFWHGHRAWKHALLKI